MELSAASTALIGVLGGFFGVLVGAYLSYRSTSQIEQKKQIIDFYMLYSSSEFTISRNEAGNVLRAVLNEEVDKSWDGLHKQLGATGDWEKISRVDHFFRSIYFLSQENLVDKKLCRTLFKEIHNHWYNAYFFIIDEASNENGTGTGTQSKLNKWLNKT